MTIMITMIAMITMITMIKMITMISMITMITMDSMITMITMITTIITKSPEIITINIPNCSGSGFHVIQTPHYSSLHFQWVSSMALQTFH